ncbi:MAG: transglutaminase family protein [Thermoplasmata archaeon]|nr:MAG: transglutaminase family protein [Thermoplasmata archaeon]KAA0014994.1 MAG: transglutaminase family protein [Thermoplasmata archaeon]
MFREWKEKEYIPPKQMLKLFIRGGFALSKVLLKNLGSLKEVRKEKVGYKPPERMYELPEYRPGMKFVKSDEKYLRPTLHCNPYSKEVIALANHLGAFEKEPYEYAKDAFEFTKRKIILQIVPLDSVEATLRRGYGTCLHKISLFIALCRVAGIKARYKLYALTMIQQWFDTFMADPLMQEWYDAMGYFMLHGEGEAYIDGKWIVADVGPTPERQAAAGIPITKFGEDSIGIWFQAIPGSIMRTESLPLGLTIASKLLMKKISPGSVAKMNNNVLKMYEKGRKILQEMGEEEYDKKARKGYKMPEIELEQKSIIFE